MEADETTPTLYGELAGWWPLLSAPEDYAEEAAFYADTLRAHVRGPLRTVLELGSGGGNNAAHLRTRFDLTLTDRAPGMLAVSRSLNPGCEHVEADMRTVRLGRAFDAVFVHDAICYMTSEADLARALETAFVHCRTGGAALFAPDHTRESFRPATRHGGHDGAGRALRYLSWTWDPDPRDSTFFTDYVYLLREGEGLPRAVTDRHVEGLFPRRTWLDLIAAAGFDAEAVPFAHSEVDPGIEVFVGRRPG